MTLFDDKKEIKQLNSAFSANFELDSIQSFLDDAVNKHIIPAIGTVTLSELVAAKKTPSTVQKTLLSLIKKACVDIAFGNYVVFGSVQIQSSGISVLSSTNTRPVSDAKIGQLRKQSLADGYTALEMAVEFLESHIKFFASYEVSDEHRVNRSLFLNSSKEFSKVCLPINAQLFHVLRSEISRIGRHVIEPVLGEELSSLLHRKITSNTLSTQQGVLVEYIQTALAHLALANTIPYRLVKLDNLGGFQVNDSEEISPGVEQKLQVAMMRLNARGETELATLKKWLDKNRLHFKEYQPKPQKTMQAANNVYLL